MSSRNSFASVLMACLLAAGFLGIAPATHAGSGGKSSLKAGEGARKTAAKIKRRARAPRISQPRGPGQIYYDYPYYYSRGHYPTHIVRYVYDPPYAGRATYRGRCVKGDRKCATYRDHDRGPASPRRHRARRN